MVRFFNNKKTVRSYGMIFVSAIIYTIGIQGFIQEAKVFSAGLGAFAQLPTLLKPELFGNYFSLFYLVFNLPLIIFFWRKNKTKFMVRTLFFLVVQTGLGALFFIPQVSHIFSDLLQVGGSEQVVKLKWPILVLTLIGSILVAIAIAISWKYGGSTAGTDIVAYYFSTQKQKSVGSVMFVISMCIIGFSLGITIGLNETMRSHWLVSIASSASYVMLASIIIDKLYPKFKKVEARIVSEHWKEIEKAFINKRYSHSWRLVDFVSSKGKQGKEIVTVAFWLETKDLVKIVKSVDSNAWISLNEVRSVIGKFNASQLDIE